MLVANKKYNGCESATRKRIRLPLKSCSAKRRKVAEAVAWRESDIIPEGYRSASKKPPCVS